MIHSSNSILFAALHGHTQTLETNLSNVYYALKTILGLDKAPKATHSLLTPHDIEYRPPI